MTEVRIGTPGQVTVMPVITVGFDPVPVADQNGERFDTVVATNTCGGPNGCGSDVFDAAFDPREYQCRRCGESYWVETIEVVEPLDGSTEPMIYSCTLCNWTGSGPVTAAAHEVLAHDDQRVVAAVRAA